MLGEVNDNNNDQPQPEKQKLIFRDMQGLKGAQVSGLRNELIENYDVVLPTEFEKQLKEMNNGVMPNGQQISEMLRNGAFGDGARLVDTNLDVFGPHEQQVNEEDRQRRLDLGYEHYATLPYDRNRSQVLGRGEDVSKMLLNDEVIKGPRSYKSEELSREEENQNFVSYHQGDLEKQLEDGWRQDIMYQKDREFQLEKARESDLRGQKMGERSQNRKQRGKHLGGKIDSQELQDSLKEQEREENKFEKKQPDKSKERGNVQLGRRNNNNIDGPG